MFMRQILADAISKFQKITRQMLCDKYLLTPSENSKRSRDKCYAANVPKMTSLLSLKMLTSYGGKNADVIWRENFAIWGAIKLLL
jgi:hypothetical protein